MQGTQKSVQAWTVHGLAVKAALQLGLHSKDASRVFSPQEKEIRKRTWYGCVVFDRYGNPINIARLILWLTNPSLRQNFEHDPGAASGYT